MTIISTCSGTCGDNLLWSDVRTVQQAAVVTNAWGGAHDPVILILRAGACANAAAVLLRD